MDATLILRNRAKLPDDAGLIEQVIWRVPQSVPPCTHPYKYRLVYIVDGVRVVGYDNERGKGDHKHIEDEEIDYTFKDVYTLVADFWADVERINHGYRNFRNN